MICYQSKPVSVEVGVELFYTEHTGQTLLLYLAVLLFRLSEGARRIPNWLLRTIWHPVRKHSPKAIW